MQEHQTFLVCGVIEYRCSTDCFEGECFALHRRLDRLLWVRNRNQTTIITTRTVASAYRPLLNLTSTRAFYVSQSKYLMLWNVVNGRITLDVYSDTYLFHSECKYVLFFVIHSDLLYWQFIIRLQITMFAIFDEQVTSVHFLEMFYSVSLFCARFRVVATLPIVFIEKGLIFHVDLSVMTSFIVLLRYYS